MDPLNATIYADIVRLRLLRLWLRLLRSVRRRPRRPQLQGLHHGGWSGKGRSDAVLQDDGLVFLVHVHDGRVAVLLYISPSALHAGIAHFADLRTPECCQLGALVAHFEAL